ncbi:tyrosine-type recombinase/integrase [Enterovibrio norvegicus]|uniref:tyrosine-type recombinase/integrase n=1 Tax=Enterovibrio norvegicus TaxID=188144 RepID=UPI00352CEDF1
MNGNSMIPDLRNDDEYGVAALAPVAFPWAGIKYSSLTQEERESVMRRLKVFWSVIENDPKNTRDALYSQVGLYVRHCESKNIHPFDCGPEELIKYFDEQATRLHRNTLKQSFWAINTLFKSCSLVSPLEDALMVRAFKQICTHKAELREEIKQATPLKLEHLNRINDTWGDSPTKLVQRDLAILNVAYAGLLRASELLGLKVSDVDFKRCQIRIMFSKTDKSGFGKWVAMTTESMEYLKAYLQSIAMYADGEWTNCSPDDPVFLKFTPRWDKWVKSTTIKHRTLVDIYKKAFLLVAESYPKEHRVYSTHSPRVGATQDLWEAGVPITEIITAGRWSDSSMPTRYGQGHTVYESPLERLQKSRNGR